jgi:hypothetical protein
MRSSTRRTAHVAAFHGTAASRTRSFSETTCRARQRLRIQVAGVLIELFARDVTKRLDRAPDCTRPEPRQRVRRQPGARYRPKRRGPAKRRCRRRRSRGSGSGTCSCSSVRQSRRRRVPLLPEADGELIHDAAVDARIPMLDALGEQRRLAWESGTSHAAAAASATATVSDAEDESPALTGKSPLIRSSMPAGGLPTEATSARVPST